MKTLTSILLYAFAQLFQLGIALPALIHTIIDQLRFKGNEDQLRNAFFEGALALDIYGNVAYSSFLNAYFLQRGGVYFGTRGETISSVLGKNWTLGKLTFLGEGLAGLLNAIDPDHCYKSINQQWFIPKPERIAWYKLAAFSLVLLLALAAILFVLGWAFIRILH